MTSNVSFDRELRTFLDEKAGHVMPQYLSDVLVQTSNLKQRRRWMSMEWWLRVDSARHGSLVPWPGATRLVLVALLLLALVGAVVVGALLRRPAPPFGLAGNGVIAIANPTGIVIADADGGNQRILVEAPDGVEGLTWSPDGTKLAYRTLSPSSGEPAVMVIDRDGSNVTDVTAGLSVGGFDEPISWSPDSARLAIPSPERVGGGLLVAEADGTGAHAVDLASRPAVVAAAWSPDGQWLALAGEGAEFGELNLILIRPDGSGERRLSRLAEEVRGGPPQWAPDPGLSQLVYVEADGDIVVYDVSTDRLDQIAATGMWPSWSPDAKHVAWWDDGIVIGDVSQLLDGGTPARLVTVDDKCPTRGTRITNIPCGPPTWSPDGRWVFAPDLTTKAVIATSVDGSEPLITIVLPPGTELNPIGSAAWQRIAPPWWP